MPWLALLLLGCRESLDPPPAPLEPRAPYALDRLLRDAVDHRGDVDYARLRAEREVLRDYARWIARPRAIEGRTGPQLHAFWLNAFHALVLVQVVERGIEGSVNEVPSLLPWPGSRFWYGTAFVVAGEPMSLWELGHERITHTTQDYRDFAALPVAARSGPPARAGLYDADQLDAQLDAQMAAFVGSDRGVRLGDDGSLAFNPVFDRYAAELSLYTGGDDACRIAARHATGDRRVRLLRAAAAGCPHTTFPFDWSLDQSAP